MMFFTGAKMGRVCLCSCVCESCLKNMLYESELACLLAYAPDRLLCVSLCLCICLFILMSLFSVCVCVCLWESVFVRCVYVSVSVSCSGRMDARSSARFRV